MDEVSFSSDRPISSSKDDLLGRAKFAHAIADALRNWNGKDSLVVALYGPWGSGKTSVKNMVIERVQAEQHGPYLIEFNPWQSANQKPIAEAFFRDIALSIGAADPSSEGDDRAAKLLEYYAELAGGGALAGGNLDKAMRWAFALSLVAILATSWLNRPSVKAIATIVASLLIVLGVSGDLLKQGAKIFRSRGALREKPLSTLKTDLSDLLSKSKRPVLVFMDDIDRLTAPEILAVCQLVKANADFPNLIYVLLFQRDLIERRLQEVLGEGADEYLEKIVQVSFTMPQLERVQMEKFLFAGLDNLLATGRFSERFQKDRWESLFHGGLREYFQNLRDVKRFLGTLKFQISLLSSSGTLEVNPVDLIGIEVIRTFEPAIYAILPAHKDALTKASLRDGDRTKLQPLMEKIKSSAKHSAHHGLLTSLFPVFEWYGSRYASVQGQYEDWLRDLRICYEQIFDRYFQFSVPSGDLPQFEVDQVLAVVGDECKFSEAISATKLKGLLSILLERLFVNGNAIPASALVPMVKVFSVVGEDILERKQFFQPRPEIQMAVIIRDCVNRDPDENNRTAQFLECVKAAPGLFIPVLTTDMASRNQQGEAPFKLPEPCLNQARQILVERIQTAAENGTLIANPRMGYFLEKWVVWGPVDAAAGWAKQHVASPQGAFDLAMAFTQKVISSAGDHWHADLKGIEKLVDLQQLEQQLTSFSQSKLTLEQKEKLTKFNKALERRKEGKQDFDWMSSGD